MWSIGTANFGIWGSWFPPTSPPYKSSEQILQINSFHQFHYQDFSKKSLLGIGRAEAVIRSFSKQAAACAKADKAGKLSAWARGSREAELLVI